MSYFKNLAEELDKRGKQHDEDAAELSMHIHYACEEKRIPQVFEEPIFEHIYSSGEWNSSQTNNNIWAMIDKAYAEIRKKTIAPGFEWE